LACSLRLPRLTILSFPLVEGGLPGEAADRGGATAADFKPPLQILGPVGADE